MSRLTPLLVTPKAPPPDRRLVRKLWSLFVLLPMAAVFLVPTFMTVLYLSDPACRNGEIPRLALVMHERMAPGVARWAMERINSGRAEDLAVHDIAGTEWPMFGSVFYLLAMEALQEEWKRNPSRFRAEPASYARAAIDASRDLILDPNHAHWVKSHWGDDYLRKENVFYRMLLIWGITCHHRLTGDTSKLDFLREQATSLAAELDASRFGLLDDYPGQCYPGDIVAAVAAIRAADTVLGTDHSAWAERQIRCVTGDRVGALGLPAYSADARSGRPHDDSRGCGNSYMTLFGIEPWPQLAADWYSRYTEHFWSRRLGFEGFREFPNGDGEDWYMDVDSGPVLSGFGFAACGFGLGAARVHGRMDHAWPLTAEAVTLSVPWPGGRLLVPQLLSNGAHSPFLGESAILYCLTRTPKRPVAAVQNSAPPLAILVILGGATLMGVAILRQEIRYWKSVRRSR